jgi:hypothetical protein
LISTSQEYRASSVFFPWGAAIVFGRGVARAEAGEELPPIGLKTNLDAFDGVLDVDDGTLSDDFLSFFAFFDLRGVFVEALSETTKPSLSVGTTCQRYGKA